MVIVNLQGGLGNQMFQYAAGKALAEKKGGELKFDLHLFTKENARKLISPREFELGIFEVSVVSASDHELNNYKKYSTGYLKTLSKIANHLGLHLPMYYKESGYPYNESLETLPPNVYLDGYWQTEKYFKNIEETIRKDFSFKTLPNAFNQRLIEKMNSIESVSLHVRRGDYISDPLTNQFHGVCSVSYYKSAVQIINSKVKDPHFFIFSDDIPWSKKNIIIADASVDYIDHNHGSDGFEDLRLMSVSKHNIIANSSFSWWGAWLNRNPNKIVIAPSKWFNDPKVDVSDMIPKSWIKL